MGSVTQTRVVVLDISDLLEDFIFAYQNQDFEDCELLKKHLNGVYNSRTPTQKASIRRYLARYIKETGIDPKKDLNGLTDSILADTEGTES